MVVAFGTALQAIGLGAQSWLGTGNGSAGGTLALNHPGDALLLLGMAVTVVGTLLGFLGLGHDLSPDGGKPPRLLPILPLVLLVGLSLGGASFAYQAADSPRTSATGAVAAPAPSLLTTDPTTCADGMVWHDDMGHCMSPEAIAALAAGPDCPDGYVWQAQAQFCALPGGSIVVPSSVAATARVCPADFFWHAEMNHCMEVTASGSAPAPLALGDPAACPSGTVWHAAMDHCMPTACPAGFQWDAAAFTCRREAVAGPAPGPVGGPACPDGTVWHPAMNHCMSTVCPAGFEWSAETFACQRVSAPEPPPVPTSTPRPDEAPKATPAPDETPACPKGYFWHEAMGHCMSTGCPPPLVFDPGSLTCVLPPRPSPTPPDRTCPEGYFWHEDMGHCMSYECPPPLVFNPDSLYCEPPPDGEAPPIKSTPAAPDEAPSCPEGYFWHEAMGHCMSTECPPLLVFDPDALYCALPGAGAPASSAVSEGG